MTLLTGDPRDYEAQPIGEPNGVRWRGLRRLPQSFDGRRMKKLSRWMPAAPVRKTPRWGWPVLVLLVGGFAYLLYLVPWLLVVVVALVLIGWWLGAKHTRHMRAWALRRSGEDICTFVRDFDPRDTDTWVLRAVYEELSRYLQVDGRPFPIRADDRWAEDLQIDSEDIELDVLPDIAHRVGRSLEDTKKNPFYDRVKTVRDLVGFLEHQPRLQSVEQIGAANAG